MQRVVRKKKWFKHQNNKINKNIKRKNDAPILNHSMCKFVVVSGFSNHKQILRNNNNNNNNNNDTLKKSEEGKNLG